VRRSGREYTLFHGEDQYLHSEQMLMVTSSDTTSTALAATTHYMVKNPQCLKEATKEVREIFKDMREIVHQPTLSNCTYLKSCIDKGESPFITNRRKTRS
jgi:cytochrome P450